MTEQLAQARTVAAEFVARLVAECAKGVSDREKEAAALAGQCGLDVEDLQRAFARAREVNQEAKQVASRAEAKPYTIVKRPLTGTAAKPEEDFAKALNAAIAPVQPADAPEAEPAPEPVAVPAAKPAWPDAPEPPAGASALERLTYPRGLLGHALQYIYDTDALPDRTMALIGALCALAKALDRKVLCPGGMGTVLPLARR